METDRILAYLRASAALHGCELAPAQLARVAEVLARNAEAAALVMAFPLADTIDLAPAIPPEQP